MKLEYDSKQESRNSVQQTGERLLSRSILSRPNTDTVRTRLDIVITRWEILRADIATRIRGLEGKLQRVCQFLTELEELSLWASNTRELLRKPASDVEKQLVNPKVVCLFLFIYLLSCVVLCRVVLSCVVLCRVVSCCVMSCRVLCCIVLCCGLDVVWCGVLCLDVLCCIVVLCFVWMCCIVGLVWFGLL